MRRRLLRAFWIGHGLTMLILLVLVGIMVVSDINTDFGSLRAILHTASAWTMEASSNLQELADKIASAASPLQVTFIMPNGIILAESGTLPQNGQSLLLQPEVQQALALGMGEHLSFEQSWLHPSVNAATLLSGRLILHLSNPIQEVYYLITVYLPVIAVMGLLMVWVSRNLLHPVTRNIDYQLRQIQGVLEGTVKSTDLQPQGYYPELRPALENITYLIDRMRYDLEQIGKTQDMQRDFVDNSSHELKSPLTSIAGFAEMIHDDPHMELEERQQYLGFILTECQRMIAIINDILLLEKQAHRLQAAASPNQVHKVAQEVATSLMPQAQTRRIQLKVSGQGCVKATEQDLYDLLRNLMSNAIRYGRESGFVQVLIENRQLQVKDNGLGINPEHQQRIFEKIFRADSARHRQDGGSGLGLSIVAAITNRYGAKIQVDSQPGVGSVFTVVFPE